MKPIKPIITVILLFIAFSLSAQRVHYKDNYYTLVNSKIFHLGHNVYGKLTQGERDTLYIIAKELYNDIGKLKPHYKSRRKRDRYKLPEGFWDKKSNSAAVKETAPVSTASALVVTGETVQKEKSILATTKAENKNEEKEKAAIENDDKSQKENKDQLTDEGKKKDHQQKEQKSNKEIRKESNQEKEIKKSKEVENSSKKERVEKDEERREKLIKEQKEEERSAIKDERKEEKKLKKEEEKLQKAEKEQKRKEKEIQAKEKAIKSTKEAKKKLKNTQEKYKKLKERGELSPNDEAEWLEKIEKLKEKLVKTEKKVG